MKQCAAVRIHLLSMIVPAQCMKPTAELIPTCHGQVPAGDTDPPIILFCRGALTCCPHCPIILENTDNFCQLKHILQNLNREMSATHFSGRTCWSFFVNRMNEMVHSWPGGQRLTLHSLHHYLLLTLLSYRYASSSRVCKNILYSRMVNN